MPRINPEILSWARETAGLDFADAARKVSLGSARGMEPADRLAAMEQGAEEPSRALLGRMAKQYRRPLVAFYLAHPPTRGDRGSDFRMTSATGPSEDEPLLDALIRTVRARQALVRAALEDEDGVEPVRFVGRYSIDEEVADLVSHITAALDFDLAAFRQQRTVSDAFSYLRAKAEDAGVFVLLVGDLGSHHTAISTDTFRGYAIADPIAPFLVINDRDARSAWSFTLLHELCHVFTGYSGVSGGYAEVAVERVCNDVASAILLPEDDLDELASGAADTEAISGFAEEHNLSRTMVAYRLFRSGRLPREAWLALQRHFTTEWLDYRDEMRARGREQEGGPTYYVVRRHRLGPGLLGTVAYLLKSGSLTTVKAGRVLGVKPKNVAEVLSGTSSAISV